MPASTRVRDALAKLMEKGLSVEEIVRFDGDCCWEDEDDGEEERIQLKGAWAFVGEVA